MERKLNLGCGDHLLKDFVNVDQSQFNGLKSSGYDIKVDNIIYLKYFENDSVDFIYSSHVLQCIDPRSKVTEALKNWYRVLKPKGQVIIEAPNIIPITKAYLEGKVKIETFIQGIYGVDKSGIRQFACFDFGYLQRLLEEVGFKNVKQIEQPKYSRHDPNTNIVVEAWK